MQKYIVWYKTRSENYSREIPFKSLEKAKSFASLSIIYAKIFVNLHPESKLKIER